MGSFRNDLKYSLRTLVGNPIFTLTAIAALALGIGANTAIFTVIDNVLLKPLTYPESDRIVQFLNTSPNGKSASTSPENFNLFRIQTSVLQDVAAYDYGGPGFNLTGSMPEQVHGIHVSEAYFRLFGARVLLGRTFTPQEDSPNGGHVVVISYGFWQRKFGGDRNIVGKTVSLSSESYTIVGVLDNSFFTDPPADLWIPFQIDPNSTNLGHYFLAAGRLKPGISLAQANAVMKLAADQFRRLHPEDLDPQNSFSVMPLRDSIVAEARSSLLVLFGAVSFVLLIACANVANLQLVRGARRRREFAVRSAMGASPFRIMRQLLIESVVLSLVGGILGLLLGYVGVRALLAVSPDILPRIGEHGTAVGIDWRILAFAICVSLVSGALFGLFPAIAASRPDLNASLKEGSLGSGTGRRHGKVRSLLVISEISLALVLLAGAALLIRTYAALSNVRPGFDAQNVLTLEMSLTGDRYLKTAGVARLAQDGRERVNAIPGIEESTISCSLPLSVGYRLPFNIVGRPTGDSPWTGATSWMSASPGYLSVFKIPLLRGRDFTEQDNGSAPGVVIINETLAKKYWSNQDPIGQMVLIGKGVGPQFVEAPRRIIGIISDIHDEGLNRDPSPMMIVPSAQVADGSTALIGSIGPMVWAVRTRGDPHQYITAITEQLRIASGGFPVARVRSMSEVIGQSLARQDFNMRLLTGFGATALLLAAIGIYGVMAYSVQQRTQEMGIRMSLGADRGQIRNLIVWQGMRLAISAVILGLAAAFGLTRFLASFLYNVKPWDPLVFLTVPVVLSAVSLLAVWIPATRAARLDPQNALRVD